MQQSLAPKIASVLNLSEDHIDRHKTLSNYQRIKLSIYNRAQYRVVNFDDALTHPEHGYHMSFSQDNNPEGFGWDALTNTIIYAGKPVLNLNNTSLIGSHNALNLQAAAAMALQLGVGFADMQLAAERFIPLAHRCQLVAEINNTRWINDSKATNVGATLAAIKGLTNHFLGRLFLIVGGDSKGADLSPLSTILKSVNTYLLTLGQDALHFMRLGVACEQVVDLEQAVTRAASLAKSGDIVLLSPACASQDMFDNFEHRGEVFMKAVQEQQ
jgi:UDP-N-acetylmuramoylalanine--D-glutamate ligase